MANRELNLYPELAAIHQVNRSQLIRTCPSDGRARRSLMLTVHYNNKGIVKFYRIKGQVSNCIVSRLSVPGSISRGRPFSTSLTRSMSQGVSMGIMRC